MTDDPRQSATPGLLAGFLIGAAVGALTALLYAPKSGDETRDELADVMQARLNDLRGRLEQVKRDLAVTADAAKTGFREGAARMRRQLDVE